MKPFHPDSWELFLRELSLGEAMVDEPRRVPWHWRVLNWIVRRFGWLTR